MSVSARVLFSHTWRNETSPSWLPWRVAVWLDRHRKVCEACGVEWMTVETPEDACPAVSVKADEYRSQVEVRRLRHALAQCGNLARDPASADEQENERRFTEIFGLAKAALTATSDTP